MIKTFKQKMWIKMSFTMILSQQFFNDRHQEVVFLDSINLLTYKSESQLFYMIQQSLGIEWKDQFRYIGYLKTGGSVYPGVYQQIKQQQGEQQKIIPIFVTLTDCSRCIDQNKPIYIYFPKEEKSLQNPLNLNQVDKFQQIQAKQNFQIIGFSLLFIKFQLKMKQSQMYFFRNPPELIPLFKYKEISQTPKITLEIEHKKEHVTLSMWQGSKEEETKLKKEQEKVEEKAEEENQKENIIKKRESYQSSEEEIIEYQRQKVGVYFIQKEGKVYFYGFFDENETNEIENKNETKESQEGKQYFLYRQNLDETHGSKGYSECTRINNSKRHQNEPWKNYPRNSICKIKYSKEDVTAEGTVSILIDKNGFCKYMLTCAHNFYGILIDNSIYDWDKKTQYPNFSIFRTDETNNKEFFTIKNVFIPNLYKEMIDQSIKNALSSIPIKNKIKSFGFSEYKFYDIAIIEIEKPFFAKQGFRIGPYKQFQSIDNPIQLTGFPKQDHQTSAVKNQMYYDSNAFDKDNFVKLSTKYGDHQLVLHNLYSIQGHSGSPIYESINNETCYLFGIHIVGIPDKKTEQQKNNKWSQPYGKINAGLYLYNKDILGWLAQNKDFEGFIVK